MAQHNPVVWFELPAKDLARATKFYESVFGVTLTPNEMGPMKMCWFPMERGVPGAGGSLVFADGFEPACGGTLIYFSVPSVDETLAKVAPAGGTVLKPKMSIGQYGFIGHFKDTEGNGVGVHEMTAG